MKFARDADREALSSSRVSITSLLVTVAILAWAVANALGG